MLKSITNYTNIASAMENEFNEKDISIIGLYGAWASSLNENKLPAFSFKKEMNGKTWSQWKKACKNNALLNV